MKKIVAWLLIIVMNVSMLPVSVFAQETDDKGSNNSRYTVLVLDNSASMYGTPLNNLKEAAKKFCDSVMEEADENNKLAIVTYDTNIASVCDFTTDVEVLKTTIDNMNGRGSWTNIGAAMSKAHSMLEESSANIKNIIVMADGLPTYGDYAKTGRYSYSDNTMYYSYTGHYVYEYANALYTNATSMFDDCYIYTLGYFHNMSDENKQFAKRLLSDIQNAGYYEVTNAEELDFVFGDVADKITEKRVTFKYASGSTNDYEGVCCYTDKYFYEASCGTLSLDGYNPSLSTASLCLALSAFGSNDGGNTNYTNKYKNVEELLGNLEFNDFEYNDWFQQKPQSDSIGVVAANKKLAVDNKEYTLIAVAVRGGGYESEWAGNFTLGKTGQHYGFSYAKQQVIEFIKEYIKENEITGDVKLWITGYSRAAATANLTAGAIVDGENLGNINLKKEDLYAYCFETPMGALKSDIPNQLKYNNIYNIINKHDPVTKVAMTALGFTRYGSDYFLPTQATDGTAYKDKKELMVQFYEKMDSADVIGDYAVDDFQMKKIVLKYLLPGGNSPVQNDYNNNYSQAVYLDTTINALTKEVIKTRSNYVEELQNGVRIIFTAKYGTLFPNQPLDRINKFFDIFIDKLCSVDTLCDIAVAAINPLAGETVENVIKQIAEEALNEAGINNYSPTALAEFVGAVAKMIVQFVITHPNLTITGIANVDTLGAAHYPELCYAWLMSLDDNYTTNPSKFNGNGNYRIIRINCPIDVEVYDDNNNLVASIVNNEPQDVENSTIIASYNEDGEKLVILPANGTYSIKMSATDSGEVHYSVNEYSSSVGDITRIVNYKKIQVEKGDILMASVPTYIEEELNNDIQSSTTQYSLATSAGIVLTADQDIKGTDITLAHYMISVSADNAEHGLVSGQGIRTEGGFAQIEAVAQEGYDFVGWYNGETLVSEESTYRFCVENDITLVAHFKSNTSTTEPPTNPTVQTPTGETPTGDGEVSVNTGDNASMTLWFVLMMFAMLIVLGCKVNGYNKQN